MAIGRFYCAVLSLVFVIGVSAFRSSEAAAQTTRPTTDAAAEAAQRKREQRRLFQDQELITAKPFTYIFNSGDPPRFVWRDIETVRQLGCDGRFRVRWFDSDLNEAEVPKHPGRWCAWIEGTAPNGTPFRRCMTLYCRPPGFLIYPTPEIAAPVMLPAPIDPQVWREHEPQIARLWHDLLFRSFNDSAEGAAMIANLAEARPLGHPATDIDSAAVRNDDFNLAVKLKVLKLCGQVRELKPPRRRAGAAAQALHEGSMAEAGMKVDAAEKIETVCRQWAQDSGEPFATLVARHGVIVVHGAFGNDSGGKPVPLDYRCTVFSITKSTTAILFSQFADQGLIHFDDSIADVFPDFPKDSEHVPTFRQCLTHMSGLSGHGDWGGCRNPQLENIILNGIDANEAGKAYNYSGMGFDLAAKAMEIRTGKSWRRVFQEHLFGPLGFGDVPMSNASADAAFTARELGILGQWIANRGSYGDLEFISPSTFEQMLPQDLSKHYPGVKEEEGIGMHWLRHVKSGRSADSKKTEDLIFSPHTVGHGSFSACIFLIDLDNDLVVVQIRKQAGQRYGEWSSKFFQTIADQIER